MGEYNLDTIPFHQHITTFGPMAFGFCSDCAASLDQDYGDGYD